MSKGLRIVALVAAAILSCAAVEAQTVTSAGGAYSYPLSPSRALETADVAVGLNLPTTGTTEQTLRTWTIPANALPVARQGFRVMAMGVTANNANAKTLGIYIGNQGVCAVNASVNGAWNVACAVECWATSSTTIGCRAFRENALGNGGGLSINGPFTVDYTGALTVTVRATTATSAGDFTLQAFAAHFFRP